MALSHGHDGRHSVRHLTLKLQYYAAMNTSSRPIAVGHGTTEPVITTHSRSVDLRAGAGGAAAAEAGGGEVDDGGGTPALEAGRLPLMTDSDLSSSCLTSLMKFCVGFLRTRNTLARSFRAMYAAEPTNTAVHSTLLSPWRP